MKNRWKNEGKSLIMFIIFPTCYVFFIMFPNLVYILGKKVLLPCQREFHLPAIVCVLVRSLVSVGAFLPQKRCYLAHVFNLNHSFFHKHTFLPDVCSLFSLSLCLATKQNDDKLSPSTWTQFPHTQQCKNFSSKLPIVSEKCEFVLESVGKKCSEWNFGFSRTIGTCGTVFPTNGTDVKVIFLQSYWYLQHVRWKFKGKLHPRKIDTVQITV